MKKRDEHWIAVQRWAELKHLDELAESSNRRKRRALAAKKRSKKSK